MQFLNPIWLWSALGILIPIAIHLWNQQPGKILEVGSIRFMDPSSSKRSSKLQLTEIWLLLLRCCIILLLTLFLAKPVWNTQTRQSNQGWILLPRASMSIAYQTYRQRIDSLLQLGMELHALEPGFPLIAFNKDSLLNDPSDLVPNFWTLATQLEKVAPAQYQLHVFTPEQLQFYQGLKPILHRALVWNTYPIPSQADPPRDKSHQTIRVTVFANHFATDADYLIAACKAIQDFSGDTILLTKLNTAGQIPKDQDWLFWLSDQPLPKNNAKHSWSYQLGNLQEVPTLIYSSNWSNQEKIPLYKYSASTVKGEIIWENGFGQAVLEKLGNGQYLMHTRFHPDWNGLVWSHAFPGIMMPILLGSKPFDPKNLAMDPSQIIPQQMNQHKATLNDSVTINQPSLEPFIWILILILLILERAFVFYQSKQKRHG